jgi:hypothetical protein
MLKSILRGVPGGVDSGMYSLSLISKGFFIIYLQIIW